MTLPSAALGLVLAIAPVQTSTADRALTAIESTLEERWKRWEKRAKTERVLREECDGQLEVVLGYVRGSTTAVLVRPAAEASGTSQEPRSSGWLWFGAGTGVGALAAILAFFLGR